MKLPAGERETERRECQAELKMREGCWGVGACVVRERLGMGGGEVVVVGARKMRKGTVSKRSEEGGKGGRGRGNTVLLVLK